MKLMNIPLLCAVSLIPLSLLAQEPIRDPLLRWMNQIAQRQLEERHREMDKIHKVADAERRKQKVRESLLSSWVAFPTTTGR